MSLLPYLKMRLAHREIRCLPDCYQKQKIKYIYPSPTLVNQSDIIANSNSSFKNNKSVSPSYMMNNNNNRKENYSIYDIDNNNLSNELYYSGNNISINNYNLYRYQINTTNYSQNY